MKMKIQDIFTGKIITLPSTAEPVFPGGRLAAICLETGEEFYSSDQGRIEGKSVEKSIEEQFIE